MKHKSIWVALLLLMALLLAACGGDAAEQVQEAVEEVGPTIEAAVEEVAPTIEAAATEAAAEVEEPAEPSGPFRVAVVMPSATNDLAFSQSMFDALSTIQEEMGAENFEFDFSDGLFVVDDAAAAIRDYAAEGFDLVIAHGSQYGASLQEIAPDFPETSFAWGTTVDTFTDQGINNVFAYEARSEQGGYVNGVIAASLSESDVIGVVGPIETGDAKLYVDGFVAGVMDTKPDAEVNVAYTGSFSDVALASEAAETHIGNGADALTGTAQMVVGAIGKAEENDVLWFGTQANQTSLAPDIVVANQVYDWTVALDEIISLVNSGTLGGQAFAATLANGGLVMEYNPDFDLPSEVQALADETVAGLSDGSIVVGEAPPVVEEPAGEAMEELVFGMILVGPKNDRGWSQAHFEAGQYVEEQIDGARMIVFESMNPADKPEATVGGVVDEMVADGASMIIATSDEFEEDFTTAAEKYPDVVFIHASGDDAWPEGQDAGVAPPNEGNVMSRLIEMKAIAGCAAAMATETGELGYLGPLINTETRRLAASAYLGARYCYENYRGLNPDDLQFDVVWIGFWFNIPGVTLDPTEVVNQFYDTGADVVLSGIDTTEALDVTGRRAAEGEDVLTVAYDYNEACDLAPEVCLGVPFFSWRPMYLENALAVMNGTWEQGFDWRDPDWDDLSDVTQTGGGWVPGPALLANEEWAAAVEDFIAGYASGEINVWDGPIILQDGTEYVPSGATASDLEIWYLPQLLEGMTGASE